MVVEGELWRQGEQKTGRHKVCRGLGLRGSNNCGFATMRNEQYCGLLRRCNHKTAGVLAFEVYMT